MVRTARRGLVDVSHKPPPIAAADVMTAFSGRPLGIKLGDDKAPLALLTIRGALMERLRTTGGRPASSNVMLTGIVGFASGGAL